jgi:hypothetical protein
MPIPSGSHYTDRSRHNVRLASGRTVPRATAENMYARGLGYRGNYERRQAYRDIGGASRAREVSGRARDRGTDPDTAVRAYRDYLRDLQRNDYNPNRVDKSPDGPLANYLRSIGQKTDYTHTVGETPGTK